MRDKDREIIQDVSIQIIVFILMALMILLCSCSAQWHMKRAIKKDPSIIDTAHVTYDTVMTVELNQDSILDNYDQSIDKIPEIARLPANTRRRLRQEIKLNVIEPVKRELQFDTIRKKVEPGGFILAYYDNEGLHLKYDLPVKTVKNEIYKDLTFWEAIKKYWELIVIGIVIGFGFVILVLK